jgi:DNA-binding LytR/AlgR family response regulator
VTALRKIKAGQQIDPPLRKVLIVHSSTIRCEQLRGEIDKLPGYSVCADTFSSIEAITAIRRHEPNVVLLDANILLSGDKNMLLLAARQSATVFLLNPNRSSVMCSAFLYDGIKANDFKSLLPAIENRLSRKYRRNRFVPLAGSTTAPIVLGGRRSEIIIYPSDGSAAIEVLDFRTIEWIQQRGPISTFHTTLGEIPTKHALRRFSSQMVKNNFLRLTPMLLINSKAVASIELLLAGEASLTLRSGAKLKVPQCHFKKLMKSLAASNMALKTRPDEIRPIALEKNDAAPEFVQPRRAARIPKTPQVSAVL